MNQINLAKSGADQLFNVVMDWAVKHPVAFGIVAGIVAIGILILNVWARHSPDETTDKAPRLRGTAQVLSFEKTGRTTARQAFLYGPGWANPVCRIELEVHVPGREPYVDVVEYTLARSYRRAVKPGKTVAVEVDPANLHKIRIDFR